MTQDIEALLVELDRRAKMYNGIPGGPICDQAAAAIRELERKVAALEARMDECDCHGVGNI